MFFGVPEAVCMEVGDLTLVKHGDSYAGNMRRLHQLNHGSVDLRR